MDKENRCPGCMENRNDSQTCPHCGLPAGAGPESALHLPPGTILQDKYLLGRALGQGGFGITYIAWDQKLNLKLAIKEYLPQEMVYRIPGSTGVSIYRKTLAPHFSYGLDKYLEEARILARFAGHPCIVTVRDFFEANDTAYIVMEYVDGVTLKEYLANNQSPVAMGQALNVFMPVLDALKEVHASGIMHRDISPDNLILDSRGRVVLVDFGAARQAVSEQSRSLSVIMKPGFSPEEQYHSRGKQGPWTDIYAVAASLYCTITGITPPESLGRLSEDTLVAPSKLGVKIDPPLEKALLKAMAVRAKDRYQTVEEFQNELVASADRSQVREGYAGGRSKEITGLGKAEIKSSKAEPVQKAQKGAQAEAVKEAEKKLEPAEKPAGWAPQVAPAYSVSKKIVKTAALVLLCGLLIFGAVSLFSGGDEAVGPAGSGAEEAAQSAVDLSGEDAGMDEAVPEEGMEEAGQISDPAVIAALDADYYIDYTGGTIPIGDLPIGARVVDPSWEWEYRLGLNYSDEIEGDPTPPGEVKPVTWIVVAKDHYEGLGPHVTLLTEDLIGLFAFDDSTDRDHEYAIRGYNHWGESGTGNATCGLRPWLNSTGIHLGEGFYRTFSESFKQAVLTTTVPNKEWQNGSAYRTQDKVFIPSTTELGDKEHSVTYRIGDAYAFFTDAGDEERIAMMVGDRWHETVPSIYEFLEEIYGETLEEKFEEEELEEWRKQSNNWAYWTRSPVSNYSFAASNFGYVRCVSSAGDFLGTSPYGAASMLSGDRVRTGVRPALNLKSDTLVSEIRD